jgi:uncharacterized protein YrrD
MMTGGELLGLPAIADESGHRVGVVADVLFDDRCNRVLGVVVAGRLPFVTRRVIGFSDIQSMREDAIVVSDGSVLRAPRAEELEAITRRRGSMQGKPVVSKTGRFIGQVADVLFDEDSGEVVGFTIGDPVRNGRWRPRAVLPTDLNPIVGRDVVIGS